MTVPDYVVRPATRADLDALVGLEAAVFAGDRLSRRSFGRLVEAPSAAVLVADVGNAVAGATVVLVRRNSRTARLYSIAVAPAFAGRGIGPALLAAGEDFARTRGADRMRLEVRTDNDRAIARYHKAGYLPFGRRVDYYEDGADALRFEKPLAAGSDDAPAKSVAARSHAPTS